MQDFFHQQYSMCIAPGCWSSSRFFRFFDLSISPTKLPANQPANVHIQVIGPIETQRFFSGNPPPLQLPGLPRLAKTAGGREFGTVEGTTTKAEHRKRDVAFASPKNARGAKKFCKKTAMGRCFGFRNQKIFLFSFVTHQRSVSC